MEDLTLLYYTCNMIEEPFGKNIRNHLLSLFPEGIDIVSISHKPMEFGYNVCVSGLEVSIYNIYVQILMGAKEAKTKYVACCEDDALYNLEHFKYRPTNDTFAYNTNKWMVNENLYFYRERINMSMCIAPTDLMIESLTERFKKYPRVMTREEMGVTKFGEPGRFENRMGLPSIKFERFKSNIPTLTFNHRPSVGGVRKLRDTDQKLTNLPHWGLASNLWENTYNG